VNLGNLWIISRRAENDEGRGEGQSLEAARAARLAETRLQLRRNFPLSSHGLN
jgi:hypothetical protein